MNTTSLYWCNRKSLSFHVLYFKDWKNWLKIYLFHRHREQTLWTWGRGVEGEGETYGENNMELNNSICKIDSQWEFSVWLRELKPGLCNNLEGWYGEEDSGGRYTYGWLTLTFGRNQHNYVITLNLKINLKLKKERIKNNKKKIPSLRMSLREHHWLPLAFVRLSKIGLV